MKDNKLLLTYIAELIDQSPLGTGAGYDLPIDVDRELTKKLLGFKKIQNNPIYVQNSRGKFESSILHALSQIMFDLNKISSDLMLFSMPEFGYFELPYQLSTGSSIMPHKKNPDVLEIARANYHKIVAFEFQVKSIISNLISGYNRDLQLTKKPMINGFEVTKATLNIMIKVLGQIKVNKSKCKDAMTKELYTADKACKLVKQGFTFRDAYKKVSQEYERNL
jgi:argininosuccinate lyase